MQSNLSITIDQSTWPIITLHFPNALSVADVDAYTSAFAATLARETHFGALMLPGAAYLSGAHDPLVANRTMKWLKQYKPTFGIFCVGIAMVITDPATREGFASQAAALGEKVYGCAVGVFATQDDAQAWLSTRLAATQKSS